ncbi:LLM class flavin-dependent oxidoreductase [Actinomadura sp. LD22]|uniref:LLM class flavin-dependent oxidoreductase n=1 Tax=Actinomadura physcomitrii TaxID=2650748 RepID=A0A6I4MEI5_9ACTN|nr:LLM class flavin-dependent oxidoreductase [Actinomadura physcomitrii]MWA02644.1 LLM class flavin-dependent oxidoreductase [Actinomadura physcomitrii]
MIPLSVLDLAPVPAGRTVRDALRNTLDLARRTEAAGYQRYWLAEHHLASGVASAAPQILIEAVAAATSRIRVGSGAVQTGHWTPLSIVEQFGTIDALHPGRIDLGLGRSGQRRAEAARKAPPPAPARAAEVVDGLLIPAPFDYTRLAAKAAFGLHGALLQQPGAETPDFAAVVDDIAALLAGTYARDGQEAHATPGEGADLALWILGSSGGQSARVAGARGLPFAANYHVSPSNVLEAVEAYRAAFRPSDVLDEPYVLVSADVVVAPTDEQARELASPYALWVHSIRSGLAAIPFPTPAQAAAHDWRPEDRDLVADRVDTQFTGAPGTVVDGLATLQRVTGADELLITTITHDHADRVRSYELLAAAWHRATSRVTVPQRARR